MHVQGYSQVRTPSLCTCKVTARCVPHLCARARLQPGAYPIFAHVQGYSQVCTSSLFMCKAAARCVHHPCARADYSQVCTMLWSVTLTHRLPRDGGHALTVPRVYTIFVHVQGYSQVCTPSLCTCKGTARCVHYLCARARLQPGVYTIFVHVQGYSQVCTPSLCTCKVTARCVHHLCACAGYSQVCTSSLCTCKVTARGVQCSGR